MLRPAFKEDEWALIAVGAVLGFVVGELQIQFMLLIFKYKNRMNESSGFYFALDIIFQLHGRG